MPHKSTTPPTISAENMKELAKYMTGGDKFICPAGCNTLRHAKRDITGNTNVLTTDQEHNRDPNKILGLF